MGREISYSTFQLADAVLHLLHTSLGRLFSMSEVAVQLFHENPGAFGKELRAARYPKVHTRNRDVLRALATLGIQAESHTVQGATLITAETIEALLLDRRKGELVQPFKLALLKLASQEAAELMAEGDYEQALPVAMDAVRQGQSLFRPSPAVQLLPLYLLAAQANLGIKSTRQCEDFLGLASWLVLKEPSGITNVMRSQLSRLFGQLYAVESKYTESIRAFAEDVYYCALDYGPTDVRTTLGYYNLAKVFQSEGNFDNTVAFMDQVIAIWLPCLQSFILAGDVDTLPVLELNSADPLNQGPGMILGARVVHPLPGIPLGATQLSEIAGMLHDICTHRAETLGALHPKVGEACFATGLMKLVLKDHGAAREQLERAMALLAGQDAELMPLVEAAMRKLPEA